MSEINPFHLEIPFSNSAILSLRFPVYTSVPAGQPPIVVHGDADTYTLHGGAALLAVCSAGA
jgi:hypothetical protein